MLDPAISDLVLSHVPLLAKRVDIDHHDVCLETIYNTRPALLAKVATH